MTVVQLHEACSVCGYSTSRRRLAPEYPIVCELCNRYTVRGLFGPLPLTHKNHIVEQIGAACRRFAPGYVCRDGFGSSAEYRTRVDELVDEASLRLVGKLLNEGQSPDGRERVPEASLPGLFKVDAAIARDDGRVFWILSTACSSKALTWTFADAVTHLGVRIAPSRGPPKDDDDVADLFVERATPERNLLEAEQAGLDAEACDGLVIHFSNEAGAREDVTVMLEHLRDAEDLIDLIGHVGGAGGERSWPRSLLAERIESTSETRPWDNRRWDDERVKTAQRRYKTTLKKLMARFPEDEDLKGFLINLAREQRRREPNDRQIRPAADRRGSNDHA